ncbi:hypothetical protein [Runella limosa]|uniref:hypothetical protein n=1 Tax=Runella limosa TaxID=370978 RepID=UPI0004079AF3|nr:hypothetical protein [Runella limosa]
MEEFLSNIMYALIGVFFGLLANTLTQRNQKFKKWTFLFYLLGIVPVGCSIFFMKENLNNPDNSKLWFGFIILIVCVLYQVFIYLILNYDDRVYSPKELDLIIRKFTENSKIDTMRMFAGDLNFFGTDIKSIKNNAQFKQLYDLEFRRIQILCRRPKNEQEEIRYGMIVKEINNIELRFYNKNIEDLKVRGRITKHAPSVDAISIYERIAAKKYRVIESDVNHFDCGLFIKIFKLVWHNADTPTPVELSKWAECYENKLHSLSN